MLEPTGQINKIRLLTHVDGDKYREILKFELAINKSDFYLRRREKYLKLTFHEEGKKVLKIGKYRWDLFEDQHYNLENLNPIFAYLPTHIPQYPIINDFQKSRHADLVIPNKLRDTDFVIKAFWVNGEDGKIIIPREDKNLKSYIMKGHKYDGTEVSEEIPVSPLKFGYQRLYFDFQDLNRINVDRDFEYLVIFKPSIPLSITEHTQNYKYPVKPETVKKYGCQISQNRKDGSYFIVY
ncbi:MAG: hypothetical protein P1P90_02450 [Patescibacteria group bacterium]|nr:hypothetical protein [Patescibacteria group bacterium]